MLMQHRQEEVRLDATWWPNVMSESVENPTTFCDQLKWIISPVIIAGVMNSDHYYENNQDNSFCTCR